MVRRLLAAATILLSGYSLTHSETMSADVCQATFPKDVARSLVCSEPTLAKMHSVLDRLHRSMLSAAPFPKALYLDEDHLKWLEGRAARCAGPHIKACLECLYDLRIHQMTEAFAGNPPTRLPSCY